MRTGRALEQIRDELRSIKVELREQRVELRDQRAEMFDVIRFNSAVIRRHELISRDMTTALGEIREEVRANVDQSRAHTKAIFALIDRLQGGGAAAAT